MAERKSRKKPKASADKPFDIPRRPLTDGMSDEAIAAMAEAQKRLDEEVKLPPEDAAKHAGGRPTKFRIEYVEIAHRLTQTMGATDKEVADFLGIDDATLYRWRHSHPEFCEALKVGKEIADARVKQSLYRRAIGYSHDAVKVFNNNGEALIVPFVEHYPPDTTAGIFWMKNRDPENWREKQDIEHSGKIGLVRAEDLSDDQLAELALGKK